MADITNSNKIKCNVSTAIYDEKMVTEKSEVKWQSTKVLFVIAVRSQLGYGMVAIEDLYCFASDMF